jgi:uncharacterized protein
MHRATATVSTEAAPRYAKQLIAHLGRKNPVEPLDGEPEAARLHFAYGTATVRAFADHLVLAAEAEDPEGLARVCDVLGRHLVRFGARRPLTVNWSEAQSPAPDTPAVPPASQEGP